MRAVPSPLDSLHPRSRDDVGFHVRNSRSKNAVPASRDKEVAIKTDQHGAALQLNAISPIAKNLPTSFPPPIKPKCNFFLPSSLMSFNPNSFLRVSQESTSNGEFYKGLNQRNDHLYGVTTGASGVFSLYPPKLTETISTTTGAKKGNKSGSNCSCCDSMSFLLILY